MYSLRANVANILRNSCVFHAAVLTRNNANYLSVRLPLTRNRAHYVPLGNISKEYCPNANNVDNICVQEEGSHECHKSLENGQIQFRLNMSSGNATSVSLKVDDKVKNGTIVSLFCTARDCRNKFSNVMLFNIEIICETIKIGIKLAVCKIILSLFSGVRRLRC